MNTEIRCEWYEAKWESNLAKHGLDFELAEFVLSDPNVKTRQDNRRDYGEDRFLSFGTVGKHVLAIISRAKSKTVHLNQFPHDWRTLKYHHITTS